MPENLTSNSRQGEPDTALLENCLERLGEGEKDALSTLYDLTSAAVYGFALSILKRPADAEDVLQETYLNLYRGAKSYQSRGKPMAFILTVAKNLARMKLREAAKLSPLDPEELERQLGSVGSTTSDERLLLRALIEKLGEEERQIVLLHAVAGLKHREIAALMDLALPTVLSKYRRAIKKCNQLMGG
ncbi:RNA polymerase sigma factor [Bittarella massiliensis (ex Durand et al. 2017)]|uniref:RNA polymerase sigma factor n=1 Tax=Bittarella massiliensis (ex Durand et al. 2017) TaxID=1720313 RepID=UPI001AA10180|nr:RNA polymerase sigma factor [Bittarella massiliensis (ex Durand et al. 2017)]MBO1678963.1 RNA polymerase sigma factor [Bittarella massiliensis (ex Durand et al. 2017)]